MKNRKLTYQFHNPNTAEVTANVLLKVLIEANTEKVEKAIREVVTQNVNKEECEELRFSLFGSHLEISH